MKIRPPPLRSASVLCALLVLSLLLPSCTVRRGSRGGGRGGGGGSENIPGDGLFLGSGEGSLVWNDLAVFCPMSSSGLIDAAGRFAGSLSCEGNDEGLVARCDVDLGGIPITDEPWPVEVRCGFWPEGENSGGDGTSAEGTVVLRWTEEDALITGSLQAQGMAESGGDFVWVISFELTD